MKLYAVCLTVAALAVCPVSVFSEVNVEPGVLIGHTVFENMSLENYNAGGVVDILFGKYLSIQTGIQYMRIATVNIDYDYNYYYTLTSYQNYFDMPIDCKFKFPVTSTLSPYLLTGLNFRELVNSQSESNGFYCSFGIGAGLEMNAGPTIPFIELYSSNGFGINVGVKFRT
jgi:hypothetical protein